MAIGSVVFENPLLSNRFSSLILLFCKGYFFKVGLAITGVKLAKIREFGPGNTFSVSLLVDWTSLHMTHNLSGIFSSPK
jgi:hypothetical protein